MPVTPYVVGQWVRGERFYGRAGLIQEILEGNRNCLWILGTRRVGKTSILKQIEHLTCSSPAPRYFPLYWDFQGSGEAEDLHESFRDALLDAIDRLEALGIPLAEVESEDLFTSLTRLRRELRARDLSLLLLGDEVEELVNIHEKAPRFLSRLRRALQSPENIRTVFASTIRLWNLATTEEATTSPFLHGFTPPLLVRGLTDDEARCLIRQSQLPHGSRPRLDEPAIEVIRARCNNHPYLLQILSERYAEFQDLDRAIEEIAADQMVSFFFSADLAMLSEAERRVLRIVDEDNQATSKSIREKLALESAMLQGSLQRLEHLGFIQRSPAGEYSLVNYFFRRWFGELSKEPRGQLPGAAQEQTIRKRVDGAVAGAPQRRIDNRYDLLVRLGLGGSGEVYKAQDTLLRTVVAVKLLKREYCVDEEALERLRREVVLARDLSHPNILRIYHLGEDRGQKYITMEYVGGSDLAKVIAAEAPLAIEKAVVLAGKLASALAALHRCNVLHRDIKPSNVLIDPAGEPRIADFGLARLQWAPAITGSGTFLGTPSYASPEQAVGESLDQRSDLYALGIVMFEMVTGRLPFIAASVQELLFMRVRAQPPAPRDLVPALPAALSDLILRCLARDSAERFQSAGELHDALAALRR